MGWETSTDTMSEVKLEFDSKELAIHFAKVNNIEYYIIEPQKRKIVKKSYADNFLKDKNRLTPEKIVEDILKNLD